jgi:anhydro-N-acetylmuramic acid kinase
MKQLSGNNRPITVIGIMSGTSLDGLDLASCSFYRAENGWEFKIEATETIEYTQMWTERLRTAHQLTGEELIQLDRGYGNFLGIEAATFIAKHKVKADLIASHGHTVFHRPERGYTLQIGHGGNIAAKTNLPVISDFRSADVALGGQGAPLVPIGDKLLFGEYDTCLNLGGFANISFENNGILKAGDLCPVNIVLNYLAQKEGLLYDDAGQLGEKGIIKNELLNSLNKLEFYAQPFPRSLGREWVEGQIFPLLEKFPDTSINHLRTFYEHVAVQIAPFLNPENKVLVTGGGAFNRFLMERISASTHAVLEIPSDQLIKYKEALIFAFMGLLRWNGEINCLKTVTGASRDCSAGAVHLPI